jgi:hypothetical protein
LIRPRLQGGLGVTLLFQFFLSLFTRQIFKSLIHSEAIERTAAVYWLGTHLKNLFRSSSSFTALESPNIIAGALYWAT